MRGFHVEVKAVEKLNVRGAMEQANDDAKGKLAYLAWLKNFCPTYVMLRDDDFFTILSYCDLEALNDHYAPYPEKGSIGPLEP